MDWSAIMNTLNVLNESQLWSIIIACLMMLADIVAGFTAATVLHNIQSAKMREGIGHKVLMLILIAVSYILTVGFVHIANVSFTVPSVEVVCVYIIVMELASILENVTKHILSLLIPHFSSILIRHRKELSNNGRNS